MGKKILFILLISVNTLFGQIEDHVYQLNAIENLLTPQTKNVLDKNLVDKSVVFLGEAEHHIGSDFLAKTEFVKYLVLNHGYKDIAFEGDFFGLYFEHDKINLYSFWSRSMQCVELFEFLDEHDVRIWGFDNQLSSGYTYNNFTKKLDNFLKERGVKTEDNFIELTKNYIENRKKANRVIGKSGIQLLLQQIEKLLETQEILDDKLWHQFLKTFKSDLLINTTHKASKKGIPIRDAQMADNLNFLIKTMPDKNFIVWLANAHMAKYEHKFMKGQTMGGQFVKTNPNLSYHIAVSSIYMPYRKEKWIEKMSRDKENLLHFLPSTQQNYFFDCSQIITEKSDYAEKEFYGMFNLKKNKTNWFKHFDALVFISEGQKVSYPE